MFHGYGGHVADIHMSAKVLKHGGTGGLAPRRHQGGTSEVSGRQQGGNGTLVDPPCDLITLHLDIRNEGTEDLTCRWASSPANFK